MALLNKIIVDTNDFIVQASCGSACTAIECTLESLVERKRLLEFRHKARKKKLEHTLKIRQWEDEVDQVRKENFK